MEMSALAGEGAKQTLILITQLTFHHIMLKEEEELQKSNKNKSRWYQLSVFIKKCVWVGWGGWVGVHEHPHDV